MSKDVAILILGLIVAILPFLGFPSNFENIVFLISGLSIVVLAFLIRGDLFHRVKHTDTLRESNNDAAGHTNGHIAAQAGDGIARETNESDHEQSA